MPHLRTRLHTEDIGFYARSPSPAWRRLCSEVAQDPNEPAFSIASLRPFCYLAHLKVQSMGGAQMQRLLEMLNTPIAVLAAVVVIVTLNGYLFFGYYLPRTTTPSASPPRTERITGATTSEETHPTTTEEGTRPSRILEETTTATPTATATATATSSP